MHAAAIFGACMLKLIDQVSPFQLVSVSILEVPRYSCVAEAVLSVEVQIHIVSTSANLCGVLQLFMCSVHV